MSHWNAWKVLIEEMDCDTCLIMQEILCDEIDDEEFLDFAIDNLEELFSYIINDNLNLRIHKDFTCPQKDVHLINLPYGRSGEPARRAVWRV
jgi:hypothetical protein